MKLEMLAFLESSFSKKIELPLDDYEKDKIAKMVLTFRIMTKI